MKLLDLLRKETTTSPLALVFMAGVAGLSNAGVLAVINIAAENASNAESSPRYLFLFVVIIAIFILAQRYILQTTNTEIESIIHRVRLRLIRKVSQADLRDVEAIGRSTIYASVSKETLTISQASATMVIACQSAVLIFFTMLYLAALSFTAFCLTVAFTTAALSIHMRRSSAITHELHDALMRENVLFDRLTDLLDGFKEVKVNARRRDALTDHLDQISQTAAGLKTKTQKQLAIHFVFSQTSFYFLLATMVFVVPMISKTMSEDVIKITTAILFLVGPLSSLVGSIPIFANATTAAENIERLEKALDSSIVVPGQRAPIHLPLRRIGLHQVTYTHTDPTTGRGFTVGPIDFEVGAGVIIFITGGNGSGKTTFLKLLTALYKPESGVLRVDDEPITDATREAYRNLFSVIFSEYHLFARLYGLEDADPAAIADLLHILQLDRKTGVINGEFSTLELSAGQRKRLALMVTILEDRPIYIFDEWAADQDPDFRRRFYTELLVYLKNRGKTVIAVTHDDYYFGLADRRFEMNTGRLVELPGRTSGASNPDGETI